MPPGCCNAFETGAPAWCKDDCCGPQAHLAELADIYLPIRVGSDVALLLAMAHVIEREGLVNEDFIHDRTVEGEAFLEHVKEYPPEWAETITGVPALDIEKAAIL